MALDKRALKTGMHIADVVISGQNIKAVAKRCVTDAGKDLMRGVLTPGVRPQKRIIRWVVKRRVSAAKRRRRGQTGDVFDDGFRA